MLVTAFILFVLAFLLLDAYVIIPKAHYGVRLILGRRISKMSAMIRFFVGKGVRDEGFCLKIPFLEEIEIFPYELQTTPIKVKVFSKDRIEITVEGSVQHRPDIALVEKIYAEMSENAIKVGLVDAIESELGKIAGSKEADAFIQSREDLENLINCVLRLSVPPHHDPTNNYFDGGLFEGGEVPPEKRIEFYRLNRKKIRETLALESKEACFRSTIEERYGFDIVTFALSKIDFSPEIKKALEEKRQAEARADTVSEKVKIIKVLKLEGLSPDVANHASDVLLGKATREVHSFEGLNGVIQINTK